MDIAGINESGRVAFTPNNNALREFLAFLICGLFAFGGLFARGLYAQYEKEGAAFVPKYKKLLNATSVMSVEDTAKIAGIDLTDKAFWKRGLQSFADEIDEFERLLNE